MTTPRWQKRLEDASTQEDVVLAVNDFLALWTPDELAALAEDCRPGPIENAQNVNAYALKLAHYQYSADLRASPELRRMTTFLTKAALRIYQILEQTGEYPPETTATERGAGRAAS